MKTLRDGQALSNAEACKTQHLLRVGVLVVRAVHHLVAVVLRQNVRVIADALDEQVLPLPVEAFALQS